MTRFSDEIYLEDYITASINSVELIPLTYYRPGGLALTIYVYSGEKGCFSCPWKEYYGSRKSFDLRDISITKIIKRYNELRPDLLFFSGGDLLSKKTGADLIVALKKYGVDIGVKHNASMVISDRSVFENLDAILIEVNSLTDLGKISRLIESIKKSTYIEILVDDIGENISERLLFTVWVKDLCRLGSFAIGFYMADKSERFIESYSSLLQKFCENKYYVITSHHKYIPETINCLYCGASVGRRIDGVVIKKLVNDDKCPKCGSKIFFGGEVKRISRKIIFTRIII